VEVPGEHQIDSAGLDRLESLGGPPHERRRRVPRENRLIS
jgi:hypothetical protein